MDRATLDRELANAWHELTRPGGRFAMTSIQRNGTAMRAYADPPRSLAAVWDALGAYAERDYLVFGETRITYANAQVLVARLGGWLALRDVRRGDRVGIAMRNYPEWLIAYWACVARGIVAVGFNAWWTADEMAAALRLTEPKVMICDEERMTRLSDKTAGLIRVLVRAPATGDVLAWDDVIATNSVPLDAEVDLDDDACIFFTSGTTGAAKAARLTHRNYSTNIMNMQFAAEVQATALGRTLGGTVDLGAAPAPVGLATTPLFHVTALNCLAHPITAAGGTLILMSRWDTGEALRLIERERVTTMGGVPTMTRELLSHPDRDRFDLSSLSTLVGGGAPMPPDLPARVDGAPFGARPSTGFGMTEASGIITAISGEFLLDRPTSCGRALPSWEISIVDDEGRPAPIGEAGELCVRGPGVFAGYVGDAAATAAAVRDGWLQTGDIARIDADGFITVIDRKKDLIIRGGENVACAEVEAALFCHPAVTEACSFGVPDERLGRRSAPPSPSGVVKQCPPATCANTSCPCSLAIRCRAICGSLTRRCRAMRPASSFAANCVPGWTRRRRVSCSRLSTSSCGRFGCGCTSSSECP